jgi:hypothetical protein
MALLKLFFYGKKRSFKCFFSTRRLVHLPCTAFKWLAGFSSFQPQDGFYFSRSEMKIKKSLLILGKKN